jgi:hypothetical protein
MSMGFSGRLFSWGRDKLPWNWRSSRSNAYLGKYARIVFQIGKRSYRDEIMEYA